METAVPPAGESVAVDRWGNYRGDPKRIIEERHGDDFIRISIYWAADGVFRYGFQVKVGTMIRQKAANAAGDAFSTVELARMAASVEIEGLCGTNKNVKRAFADFTQIRYSQRGLFEED
jgi:hypothetical protein